MEERLYFVNTKALRVAPGNYIDYYYCCANIVAVYFQPSFALCAQFVDCTDVLK